MTEAEWLRCGDPEPMLEFLRGKASDRKLRLFAVACCRIAWHLIVGEPIREAIRVTERHADGLADDAELAAAVRAAHKARRKRDSLGKAAYDAARYHRGTPYGNAWGLGRHVASALASADVPNRPPTAISRIVGDRVVTEEIPPNAVRLAWDAAYAAHLRGTTDLLRDVIGNPFRPPALDPRRLTSVAVDLARAVYDERAFDRLPILADALEDAGCDDADVLAHCRGGGPHVRGYWVVDLVLGKS